MRIDQSDTVMKRIRVGGRLHAEIEQSALIHGVTIGRWDDRETWSIQFKPEATKRQRQDAHAALSAFNVEAAEGEESEPDRVKELERRVEALENRLDAATVETRAI